MQRFNGSDRLAADSTVLSVVVTLGGWSVLSLVTLVYFSAFTVESYFILVFIGLLATTQLFAPVQSRPLWWVALRLLVAVGYIVFALVLFARLSEMLL